jgi:hypothetical protein
LGEFCSILNIASGITSSLRTKEGLRTLLAAANIEKERNASIFKDPLKKHYILDIMCRIPVMVLSPVPSDPNEDLAAWFEQSEAVFSQLRHSLEQVHFNRIKRLQEMPRKATEILWWPFTQHSMVPTTDVTVIDSRCGGHFSIHKVSESATFDCCIFEGLHLMLWKVARLFVYFF